MLNQPELRFSERQAQQICWLRAVEEADQDGLLIPLKLRWQAADESRPAVIDASAASWLAQRAGQLLDHLGHTLPGQQATIDWSRPGRGLAAPVLLVALLLGASSNALGPSRQVNVLALPLLGLITWNVLTLILGVAVRWLPQSRGVGLAGRLAKQLQRFASRCLARLPLPAGAAGKDRSQLWRHARAAFTVNWLPLQLPLVVIRCRRLLHLSALALVAGAVAGMYLRGMALAYRPSFESTFLSAATVDRVLAVILAPAAALLGRQVPSVAGLGGTHQQLANQWIHLWALTAVIFVLGPRLLLVGGDSLALWRRSRGLRLVLPQAYLQRLLGGSKRSLIELLPYSHQPSSQAIERLTLLLMDHAGARAEIRLAASLDYGAEAPADEPGAALRVLWFSLAQTPEVEVQGELLQQQRRADGSRQLLLIVDGTTYRQRLGRAATAGRRLQERRRAWDLLAAEYQLQVLHLQLDEDLGEAQLAALRHSLWPAAESTP